MLVIKAIFQIVITFNKIVLNPCVDKSGKKITGFGKDRSLAAFFRFEYNVDGFEPLF